MPVVMNMPDRGSKKPEKSSPQKSATSADKGALLSDPKVRIGLIVVALILVVGLIGLPLGWYGGSAPAPTTAADPPANGRDYGAAQDPTANPSAGITHGKSEGGGAENGGNVGAQDANRKGLGMPPEPEGGASSPSPSAAGGNEVSQMGNKRNKDLGD